jgi:hypothetical protein
MTRSLRPLTLRVVETWCAVDRGRAATEAKGSAPVDGLIEIVVIVLIVLFVLGYFGRGRFRA